MTAELVHYDIETRPLLEKYATNNNLNTISEEEREEVYNQAAQELIQRVRSGEIWFPFHKYYVGNPVELFANLKTIDLQTGLNLKSFSNYRIIDSQSSASWLARRESLND